MAAPPSTYAEWYALPEQDFYQGAYTPVCGAFEANAAPPAALFAQVATGGDTRAVFVVLGSDHRIHALHRWRYHAPPFGLPASPLDGELYCTLDDTTLMGAVTTVVPMALFDTTGVLPGIRTVAAIDAALAADPAASQLDQVLAGDPDAGAPVTSRTGMFVPPAYAASILAATMTPEGLTPRRLWLDIVGALRGTAGHEAACGSFVDWCRVAVAGGVADQNGLRAAARVYPAVAPDARLAQERHSILRMDFPHRYAGTLAAAAIDLGPVVQAFGDLRADNAQRENDRIAREAATKAASSLPSRRWNDMVAHLSNVCQDLEEVDLPPVWGAMAKNGSKLDRITLQHNFDSRVSHPDSLSHAALLLPPG